MDDSKEFNLQRTKNISSLAKNALLKKLSIKFIELTGKYNYSLNFDWLGRPIIQFPQDIVAMQEIIWKVKPDLIVEKGIAGGGSLIFYASILELIGKGDVVGIDIDIREHNRKAILAHPLSRRISMLRGSSTDPKIVGQVKKIAQQISINRR